MDISDLDRAFEDKYQHAFHRGIVSIYNGGEKISDIVSLDQHPFTEKATGTGALRFGGEHTMDHSTIKDIFVRPDGTSDFSKLSERTFQEFLKKADSVYYKDDIAKKGRRRNMRWGGYSARDHEIGRPYVVVGVYFFSRLVQGIIELSREPWTWHQDFLRRSVQRNHHNVVNKVRALAQQVLKTEGDWPELWRGGTDKDVFSIEEIMEHWRYKTPYPAIGKGEYSHLHTKLDLNPLGSMLRAERPK